MKTKYLLLVLTLMLVTFPARADFTGPPMEAVIAVWALGLVGGFFACLLLAFIVKTIYEEFTEQKRRHSWFMALFMYLSLAFFLYLEDSEHILSDYDDATYTKLYWTFFFLSLTFGWIIGYWITPKKKDNR